MKVKPIILIVVFTVSLLSICGLLFVINVASLTSPAHAAFPGVNGKIAYNRTDMSGDNIWVMDADGLKIRPGSQIRGWRATPPGPQMEKK